MSDWRFWKITDEQAEQIRAKDVSAIDKFYFDNLDILRKFACKFKRKHPYICDTVDDLLNSVYLDLFVFWRAYGTPVTDGVGLTYFVFFSFRFSYYGGLFYLVENNPKLLCCDRRYHGKTISIDMPLTPHRAKSDGEKGLTLGDVLPCYDKHGEDEEGASEACKRICADILTERQGEYIGYFLDGYGTTETAVKMGYKNGSCGSTSSGAIKALKKNASVILQRLEELGYNTSLYKGFDPLAKSERTFKLSPEKRARAADLARQRRARLKAETCKTSEK